MPCELAIDTKSTPVFPGLTLYSKAGTRCLGKEVGVYIPPVLLGQNNQLTDVQLHVVVWLHGFYVQNARDLFKSDKSNVRGQVKDSGRGVVLIAPHLGWVHYVKNEVTEKDERKGRIDLGDLGKGKGIETFLDEVVRALEKALRETSGAPTGDAVSVPQLTIKNLVIACHSGGGWLMRQIVDAQGDIGGKLRQCWGFDSLYNSGDATFWYNWKKKNNIPVYVAFGNDTKFQAIWLYLLGKGKADEGKAQKGKAADDGTILDPADASRKVQDLHVMIAHNQPTASDTDTLVDSIMFPAQSGHAPVKKVAKVSDAVANLSKSYGWPFKGTQLHYFTTEFFQPLLKTAKLP
jgi:hypothetical protein